MEERKTSNETARQLLESVSFELDTDLRLHPQKLDLGKAELLTDALTLPFMDIEKRLSQYVVGASAAETEFLRKSMKNYLARLNSNPLIPLQFRLKVLSRFESELELFDAEMTAAVLNAHKIGVEMVQKEARSQPTYYKILVEMVASAIDLAVRLLRHSLTEYVAPSVLATRQVFELAKLGLGVVPALKEDAASEKQRLFKAISNHEILRALDFFGKSKNKQKMVWQELQHHVGILQPRICRKDDKAPDFKDQTLLVTNMARPNDGAKVMDKLPEIRNSDCIVIPLGEYVDRLITAINRVERVMSDDKLQKNDIHTEESLTTTIVGGNAMLDAMRTKDRHAQRVERSSGTRVILNWDIGKSFQEYNATLVINEYEYAPSEATNAKAWSIINLSNTGVGLERMEGEKLALGVGAMVGLSWIPHRNEPMLGFIRWIKQPKSGEQRMGIEFFAENYRMVKGALIGGGEEGTKMRSWPLLIKPGKGHHFVLFPDPKVYRNMAFIASSDGKSAHLKVLEIIDSGLNYSLCKVGRAEEMTRSGQFDFAKS
ncbi:MAG TPA: hypothetical protein VNI58_04470 [Mariprofundaceae bacterium]|nr:hypothetical protein [Mariprofundaceae bacterium]